MQVQIQDLLPGNRFGWLGLKGVHVCAVKEVVTAEVPLYSLISVLFV